jgi:3-mercaptopyruvate sulfurtransferase SseA
VVATAADLPDRSAPDYGDNHHGVISGGRLAHWYSNWAQNRPTGIEGRLILLQLVPPGVTSSLVPIAKEQDGVFVYLVPAASVNALRDNGVSQFETDIPNGAAFDAFLELYGIDPRKDLIVLGFENQASTNNTIVHAIGRAWLYLRYWGVKKEHLAILNGALNWNAAYYALPHAPLAQQKFSVPRNQGTVTARHLGVDNTALVVSLEEVIAILKEEDGALDMDNVRIVDARGGAEAYGLKKATSTGRTDCASYDPATPGNPANKRCSTPFEGRLRGARSVPWTQFLDTKENGFRFLPFTTVKAIFDAQSGWNPQSELTIQYCRTNQRSTVTGIVANVILGYPTRFYETSFIEWGHLSYGPEGDEHPNKRILAADHPFRTDLPELTEHAVLHPSDAANYTPGLPLGTLNHPVTWVAGPNYNDEADVSPVSASWPKVNTSATTSRLSVDEDRAYLRGVTPDEL